MKLRDVRSRAFGVGVFCSALLSLAARPKVVSGLSGNQGPRQVSKESERCLPKLTTSSMETFLGEAASGS